MQNLAFAPLSAEELERPIAAYITDAAWDWPAFSALLPRDAQEALAKVRVTSLSGESACYWGLNSSGHFTTKSAYMFQQSLLWEEPSRLWTKLWKLPMAHRIRTFTWLLLRGKLLTNCERMKRGLMQDSSCSLCQDPAEDLLHVFRDCPLAKGVWEKVLPPAMLPDFLRLAPSEWLAAIMRTSPLPSSWQVGICITFWKLWHVRNLRIFEHEQYTIDSILTQISVIVRSTEKSFGILGHLM